MINEKLNKDILELINENITEIGNIKGKILWSNNNPDVSISSQNINLSSNDYDLLKVVYKSAYNQPTIKTIEILKGYDTIMTSYSVNFNVAQYYLRKINYINPTKLTLDNGYAITPNNKVENDGVCIPIYIIGYKTGFFS